MTIRKKPLVVVTRRLPDSVETRMRELFDALKSKHASVDTLSMGMSDDFELAIEEGATMVRIGTALFGKR